MVSKTVVKLSVVLAALIFSFEVDGVQITINNGTVEGAIRAYGNGSFRVREFLGIPFAQPPIGNLRFAPPQPLATKWSGTLVADKAADACMQPTYDFGLPPVTYPDRFKGNMSEDCLYLNIWTPEINSTSAKPVMVWIHGGGYFIGSALPLYGGAALAKEGDVVVVVIQYRLGIFGFLRLDNQTVTGNWGLWDQRFALQWVKENIAAFGGDPNSVTIFGESAGSGSVALHLMSSGSAPFFHRAILQSGVPNNPWAYNPNTERVMSRYQFFTQVQVNCQQNTVAEQMTCLRSKSSTEILNSALALAVSLPGESDFGPLMDNAFFKEDVLQLIKDRRIPNKPVIIGATNDEGGLFVNLALQAELSQSNMTLENFFKGTVVANTVETLFPFMIRFPNRSMPTALEILKTQAISRRDPENGIFNARKLADIYGDYTFYAGINNFADMCAAANLSVYMFEFSHRPSRDTSPTWIRAGHGQDIFFVFGDPIQYPDRSYTPQESTLARLMVDHWTTFAKNGRPSSGSWLPYTGKKKEFFRYDVTSSAMVEYGYRRDQCSLFDNVMPYVSRLMPIPETSPTPPTDIPTVSCPPLSTTGQALVGVFCSLTVIEAGVIIYLAIMLKKNKVGL